MDATVQALMASPRGILAADESHATIAQRFEALSIDPTQENRRRYRQLLLTAPGMEEFISGVIMFDEALGQLADDGRRFVELLVERGIVPGIKVDVGAKPLAGSVGEHITEGLDGLRERLAEYQTLGARFAKWRGVIAIGDETPTDYCLHVNAHALARYAALCHEVGLVPIVEPEVLSDGAHDLARSAAVTQATLETVFDELRAQRVALERVLLKPNMIVAGSDCPQQASISEVATATLECLRRAVPVAVPGIVFLSGGQPPELATAHLNALNAAAESCPWPLSFSFARALQTPALETWRGAPANVGAAQRAFLHRARCNSAARTGAYTRELELSANGASNPQRT